MSIFKKIISICLTGVLFSGMIFNCASRVSCTNNSVNNSDPITIKVYDNIASTNSKNQEIEKKQLVETFILTHSRFLPKDKIEKIKVRLMKLNVSSIMSLNSLDFTDPKFITLLSVFFGALGVDRFMIGHIGKGILKVLFNFGIVTSIIGVIWDIVDIFRISYITKSENYKMLDDTINRINCA